MTGNYMLQNPTRHWIFRKASRQGNPVHYPTCRFPWSSNRNIIQKKQLAVDLFKDQIKIWSNILLAWGLLGALTQLGQHVVTKPWLPLKMQMNQMPESHTTENPLLRARWTPKIHPQGGLCWRIQLRSARLNQGSPKGPFACSWDRVSCAANCRTWQEETTYGAESDTSLQNVEKQDGGDLNTGFVTPSDLCIVLQDTRCTRSQCSDGSQSRSWQSARCVSQHTPLRASETRKKKAQVWGFFPKQWSIKHVQRLPFGRLPAVHNFLILPLSNNNFFQEVILLMNRKGHAYNIKKTPKPQTTPAHQSLKLPAKYFAWTWCQLH